MGLMVAAGTCPSASGTFKVEDPDKTEFRIPGSFSQALLPANSLLLLPSVWAWGTGGGKGFGLLGNSFTGK